MCGITGKIIRPGANVSPSTTPPEEFHFVEARGPGSYGTEVIPCASVMCASGDEHIERCREFLESAVKLRLHSDVPLAVSLSGGLDSSVVASLAAADVRRLRGFTYGSPHVRLQPVHLVAL